jgi:hypothetical protein
LAFAEFVFVELRHGGGDVLPFAQGVGKAKIYEAHFVFFYHFDYISDGFLGHAAFLQSVQFEVFAVLCRAALL